LVAKRQARQRRLFVFAKVVVDEAGTDLQTFRKLLDGQQISWIKALGG